MKKLFKKMARYVVAAYANILYKQAVQLAEQKREMTNEMVFVITSPEDEKKLIAITVREFLKIRKKMGVPSKGLPIKALRAGCWYRTANGTGSDPMTYRDQTVRRLAFGREIMGRHNLL